MRDIQHMEKHITIKEIARMAGVSTGTVDRVIHDRGRVSKEARAAVEQTLAKVGYRPDARALARPDKKKYRIHAFDILEN